MPQGRGDMSWAMVLVCIGGISAPVALGVGRLESGAWFQEPHLGIAAFFLAIAAIGVVMKLVGWPKWWVR